MADEPVENKEKIVTVRLPEALWRHVRNRFNEENARFRNFQPLLLDFLERFAENPRESGAAAANPPDSAAYQRDQEWHVKLDQVLRSSQRRGIEYNLEWAVQAIAPHQPPTDRVPETIAVATKIEKHLRPKQKQKAS